MSGQYHGKGQLKRLPEDDKKGVEGKFVFNGDFERGQKSGYGEMYWRPWVYCED